MLKKLEINIMTLVIEINYANRQWQNANIYVFIRKYLNLRNITFHVTLIEIEQYIIIKYIYF